MTANCLHISHAVGMTSNYAKQLDGPLHQRSIGPEMWPDYYVHATRPIICYNTRSDSANLPE